MDSWSGISSNSWEDVEQQVMDVRKRKRMMSNRESARRSRLRKQKHLEEMMAQVAELRRQNQQMVSSLRATTQQQLNVDSENGILRAQAAELTQRLQSVVEIMSCACGDGLYEAGGGSWNCLSQPIMMMAADSGPTSTCIDLPRLLC